MTVLFLKRLDTLYERDYFRYPTKLLNHRFKILIYYTVY